MDEQHYPLDEAAIELMAEIDRAEEPLKIEFNRLEAMREGALKYFLRKHDLAGGWRLAENRRELTLKTALAEAVQHGG
jgi:hypothetical protein